jgi:hypothetical protein
VQPVRLWLCAERDLHQESTSGTYRLPATWLERTYTAEAGIAAEMIDDLAAKLRTAKTGGYEWVTSPFLLDLVLRKPTAM